jgi:predicted MFS family arabinose efflux permease
MTIGENLGETLGPMLGGFLWTTYGVAFMLVFRAALALTAEFYAIFLVDPHIVTTGGGKDERGILTSAG